VRKPTKWTERPKWADPRSKKDQERIHYVGFDFDMSGFLGSVPLNKYGQRVKIKR
jgi:hypothetical protein